ncbi:MAG: hypothetical protein Q9182_003811 [Xanthomendoza sp. 2 TL-2023]
MASVSSLDKDLRNMRLGKYTPQAANEVRAWIEESLGEQLKVGDLLDALKDGTALCKLANLATGPPGVRFKQSSMPFVQMENISHFLRACKSTPLNLQAHDIFQTVDLYENKDPAQVLTCISAFSRRANAIQPSKFPTVIGPRSKASRMSPESTGGYGSNTGTYGRPRDPSNTSATSSVPSTTQSSAESRTSPSRFSRSTTSSVNGDKSSSGGGVSSWSKKVDEVRDFVKPYESPLNQDRYGYMGGASQGNQGITFGGRRQITTPAPKVPSLAEKERKRREEEAEAEHLRLQAEESENKRRSEREAEEEREKAAEEERWAEVTRKQREVEKIKIEEEKRRWAEEELKWKEEEETRARDEQEAELRLAKERQHSRTQSDTRLTGQFLSQYQAEQRKLPIPPTSKEPLKTPEALRVEQLERELEKAKEREAQYEHERQERMRQDRYSFEGVDSALQRERQRDISPSIPFPGEPTRITAQDDDNDSWQAGEREYLQREWARHQSQPPTARTQNIESAPPKPPRPLPTPTVRKESSPPPAQPPRPLPIPQASSKPLPQQSPSPTPSPPPPSFPSRPLPSPSSTLPTPSITSSAKPPRSPFARPPPTQISTHQTSRTSSPSPSPFQSSRSSKAPSSLLNREMELERQRQREWEESQAATLQAAGQGKKEEGFGPQGESWDVHQYGYLGGDSQNRGGPGLGGRRQLVGPREMGK